MASGLATAVDAGDPARLSLPVNCELGQSCFIQHHVDVDPTPAARDYACGSATYNGHNGVDFRVLSATAAKGRGVAVIAAADGRVLRVRDGLADAFAREAGKAQITDRECGNGLVMAHDGGLETQYCHLLSGSVLVKPGQSVRRGESLGKIGYSGLADFAHLHFTVRRDGRAVDPFTGLDFPDGKASAQGPAVICADAAADGSSAGTLWDAEASGKLTYRPVALLQVAFATDIPNWARLEADHLAFGQPQKTGANLVVFARLLNLGAGDRVRFRLTGPDRYDMVHTSEPPGRAKPVSVIGAGRRLKGTAWVTGRYEGVVEVLREGRVIANARATHDMK